MNTVRTKYVSCNTIDVDSTGCGSGDSGGTTCKCNGLMCFKADDQQIKVDNSTTVLLMIHIQK